jgi:hypothetical protein
MVYDTYNYIVNGVYKPTNITGGPYIQWEFQDPKMKVLYHIRTYFLVISGISPYIGLT